MSVILGRNRYTTPGKIKHRIAHDITSLLVKSIPLREGVGGYLFLDGRIDFCQGHAMPAHLNGNDFKVGGEEFGRKEE
jgi:hypothetical protein